MPLTPEQLATLARNGVLNNEIEATIGRAMTADELATVRKARLVAKLQRRSYKDRPKISDTDKHTTATAERSKVKWRECADPEIGRASCRERV